MLVVLALTDSVKKERQREREGDGEEVGRTITIVIKIIISIKLFAVSYKNRKRIAKITKHI